MREHPRELEETLFPENTLAQRWTRTGVPQRYQGYCFESFPEPKPPVWAWLRQWAHMKSPEPRGVILWGPAGTGKTGLAVSACRVRSDMADGSRAVWNLSTGPPKPTGIPAPVWWESWGHWTDRLRAARQQRFESEEPELWAEMEDVVLLALDDIDVGHWTQRDERTMLRFCDRLLDATDFRLLLTTNLDRKEWQARFGDRLADRWGDQDVFEVHRVTRAFSLRDRLATPVNVNPEEV